MSDFVSFGTSALPGEPQTVGQTADGQGTGERRGRGATVLLPGNAANATALKPGDIIPGTVAGLTADGRLRTDTAHGPVFLDRATGLKAGAQVQLQVVSTGAQPELKLVQAPEAPPLAPRDRAQPALRPGTDLVARLTPHQVAPARTGHHGQLSQALGSLIDRLGGALRHAHLAHASRPEAPTKSAATAPAVLSKGPSAPPTQPRGADAIRSEPSQTQPRGADAIRSEAAQPRGADAIRSEAAQPRGADAIRSEASQTQPRGADATRQATEQPQPRGADAIRRDPATSQPRGADAIRPAPEQGQPRGADAIRRDPATAPPRGADAVRAAPPQSAPRPAAPVANQAATPPPAPAPAATTPASTPTAATTTASAPPAGPRLPEAPQEGRLLNPTQAPARAEGPAAAVVRHGAAVYRSAAGPLAGGLLSGASATPTTGTAATPALPSAAGPTGAAQTSGTPAPTAAAPTATATPGTPGAPAATGAATTPAAAGQAPATAPAARPATAGAASAPGPTMASGTPAQAPPVASPSAPPAAAPQTASATPGSLANAPQTSAAPSSGNAPAAASPAGPAPASATPPAPPPPAPLALNVRVLAMHPPGQAMSLPGSHGDVLVGTVTGSSNGQVTIATDAGTLTVRTAPPPVGTRVVMQVIAQPGTVMPTTPVDQRAQVAQSLGHAWPSLEAAVQALGQLNPALAAQTVQTALPQPGPLLTAGIALFLNALTGGNLGEWLGRGAMAALERGGRGDIARKLTDDFGQVSRLAADPATGDWRVVLLPLYAHDRVHQLRLYLRRHGADDGDEDDLGTRFVVEAELSRLGPLQLDGLWRQQRFDLIVRTRQPLPADVERGIQEVFLLAGTEANFAGGVGFQVADPFPVAPLDDGDGHAVGVFA